ncbi:hypothetical protein YC2023_098437 [Brassica napus]|uniref:(rape) hypothetical protein n=1 Tax=Brassica napus TaxID=3708 RepID=A0A816TWK1_BRANA|nr:unnamed protein product [Brassica napus]
MGTTYIKLGQFISSAPTFFPPEYVRRFLEPFNKAPPVPFEEVHKILQEELGRPRDSVYEYVDPTQLASASIAQVCSSASFFLNLNPLCLCTLLYVKEAS